jgi:hypothetical protein
MILNYIDPKFCNIILFQTNLDDFSKDLMVFIFMFRKRIKDRERFKIVNRCIQTTLDDFRFK